MKEVELPDRLELDEPERFLRVVSTEPERVSLEHVRVAEMWALVGLASLARYGRSNPMGVLMADNPACQFAHAVGFADVTAGKTSIIPGEPGRTVKMARIGGTSPTEPIANDIAQLLAPARNQEGIRRTLYYVLNELLRNALQHSHDPVGGIVGAQRGDRGRTASRPMVQVAVADNGIGIPASLRSRHPNLSDPREALDKALWPHVSSAFDIGETGSAQNAGMGLFFISEMTKLVAGRLLVATRDAALVLTGDENPETENSHGVQQFLGPQIGYPGTLVAFEMPATDEPAYDEMIETIRERAAQRTPARAVHKWIRFHEQTDDADSLKVLIRHAQLEDVAHASEFARQILLPTISKRRPIVLDFGGVPVCTQSYVHALLYEALRVAWALKVPIHVINAAPAVRSTLELLQNYALGG